MVGPVQATVPVDSSEHPVAPGASGRPGRSACLPGAGSWELGWPRDHTVRADGSRPPWTSIQLIEAESYLEASAPRPARSTQRPPMQQAERSQGTVVEPTLSS